MRYRSGTLYRAHTLPADLCACNLDTAAVAYLALIADSLVLSAMALPVLLGSENAFAEKTIAFRL